MTIAEQIATYLDSEGIGTFDLDSINSDIYIDTLPEQNQIFSIYNRVGSYSETNLGYQKIGIQVLYRGDTNPISSYEKALECYNELQGLDGSFTSTGNYIVGCISMQDGPAAIGTDKHGNFEYSMNFLVEYKT